MSIGPVGANNAWILYLDPLAGVEEVAAEQLERIGLSEGQDAMEDTEKVREEVLKVAGEAWPN